MSVERGVSMRHLYVNLGVNYVDIICRNMINSLSGRIETSVNSLIVSVKCQFALCDFSFFYHWKKLTYVTVVNVYWLRKWIHSFCTRVFAFYTVKMNTDFENDQYWLRKWYIYFLNSNGLTRFLGFFFFWILQTILFSFI